MAPNFNQRNKQIMTKIEHLARAHLRRHGFATTSTAQNRLLDFLAEKGRWADAFNVLTPAEILEAIKPPAKTEEEPKKGGAK
jgi:hypothetical protein